MSSSQLDAYMNVPVHIEMAFLIQTNDQNALCTFYWINQIF